MTREGSKETRARWVCHTCKTVYVSGFPPYLYTQIDGKPPPADQIQTLIRYINEFFDPYWFNTIKTIVPHLERFVMWRKKHRGHKLELLKHSQVLPIGYKEELL